MYFTVTIARDWGERKKTAVQHDSNGVNVSMQFGFELQKEIYQISLK